MRKSCKESDLPRFLGLLAMVKYLFGGLSNTARGDVQVGAERLDIIVREVNEVLEFLIASFPFLALNGCLGVVKVGLAGFGDHDIRSKQQLAEAKEGGKESGSTCGEEDGKVGGISENPPLEFRFPIACTFSGFGGGHHAAACAFAHCPGGP